MREGKKTAAIVLAGGRGSRMKSDVPKQYIPVLGHPLIYYSLRVFEESFIDEIVLVCGEDDIEYCKKEIVEANDFKKIKRVVAGGKERYHSVANGIEALDECDMVFIHDGARPFVNEEILKRAYDDTLIYQNAIVAVPAKDTVKIADKEGFCKITPDRSTVWMMQTPQTFFYEDIKRAYEKLIEHENELIEKGITITDDAMVMEQFSDMRIHFCLGDYKNIKITTPEDIIVAKAYLEVK